jgi:DNA-directed RNA polymerase subunit H (RpoH/RPB5)
MNQAQEIIRSFETIVDMMIDRAILGEDALSELASFRDMSIHAIATNPRPVFNIDFALANLRIIYNLHPKFKVIDVKKTLDFPGGVILVSKEKPGTLALKGLEDATKNVQVFDIKELQFNVAKHSLVPKHEPIRNEVDIEHVIKTSCVKSKFQLPLIHSTDAMSRYLALKPGELVRIRRYSPSAGEYISFRCCVKAS